MIRMANSLDFDLPMPADKAFETRLEWANERFVDLVEGLLSVSTGWLVWSIVEGWCDIGHSQDEVRQFHAMAARIAELCRNTVDLGTLPA